MWGSGRACQRNRLVKGRAAGEQATWKMIVWQKLWLPVAPRIRFRTSVLAYRALNGSGPVYIRDTVKPYTPARSLRSATANWLVTPALWANHSKSKQFAVLAPHWWNELPADIRKSLQLPPETKTHLFRLSGLKHRSALQWHLNGSYYGTFVVRLCWGNVTFCILVVLSLYSWSNALIVSRFG